MGTIQTRFGVLLERRLDRNMMVARKSSTIAIQFVCDNRSTVFNVMVDELVKSISRPHVAKYFRNRNSLLAVVLEFCKFTYNYRLLSVNFINEFLRSLRWVIPDLIRNPETIENTGLRPSPE